MDNGSPRPAWPARCFQSGCRSRGTDLRNENDKRPRNPPKLATPVGDSFAKKFSSSSITLVGIGAAPRANPATSCCESVKLPARAR